ncbi:DUF6884 domain-containing protein [Saccharopolyspora shandongensis]|uniref:DUF6884 domain-containing protein n=1 Tax=Saccharopolyspora shandongensis TaxID=418495 RepID=UPI003410AA9D
MTRLLVVPCGRAKLNHPATARLLYRSAHFRFVLAGVERAAAGAPVRVLSALHGLVSPDTVLAPYDVTMGDSGSVAADRLAASSPPSTRGRWWRTCRAPTLPGSPRPPRLPTSAWCATPTTDVAGSASSVP